MKDTSSSASRQHFIDTGGYLDEGEAITVSDEQGYNGWSNYPTWDMALWLNNDEGLQGEAYALARAAMAYEGDRTQQGILADNLKAWVEDLDEVMEAPTTGYVADLYSWAFGQIDWYELAASFLSDLEEVSQDA